MKAKAVQEMLKSGIEYRMHTMRTLFYKRTQYFSFHNTCVVFTFDTEEDWDEKNYKYYDSYKYITSGAFYQLVAGLDERDVSATFYVTPNVARDMPEVLKYLESRRQTIGLHLHPHNLENTRYPYSAGKNNAKITSYNFSKKMEYMKIAKDQVESVLGHKVLLYRSGCLSCDDETEKAAKLTGFKAISNHSGVYRVKHLGIFNLGVGREDLFTKFDELSIYKEHFEKRVKKEKIVVFSAHPMLLYNHALGEVKKERLTTFLNFIDCLRHDESVEIINQYRLLLLVEKLAERANKKRKFNARSEERAES